MIYLVFIQLEIAVDSHVIYHKRFALFPFYTSVRGLFKETLKGF